MIRAPQKDSLRQLQRLVAVSFILNVPCQRIAFADHPPHAAISSAESANVELARTINNRLVSEQSTLEKLIELQTQGHATWLEVAQRQLAVASLTAQQKSTVEFASFISALRQRLAHVDEHDDEFSSDGDSVLSAVTLQIAAARAEAHSDVQAARLMLKRLELRAAAVEQLAATNAASAEELSVVRRNLQTTRSLVDHLSSQHERDIQSYRELIESSVGRESGDLTADLPGDELQPDELSRPLLERTGFVHALLELRCTHHRTSAHRETILAQLSKTTELLNRTAAAKRKLNRGDAEIDRIRLDIEILQAEQSAADERLHLLRLHERWFVAASAIQPIDAPLPVLRIDAPTSALPLFAKGLETHLSGGQQSPLTAAAWQPVAPNWPINNWSATRQVVAPSLPLSGNANVRYSEPNYNDFYAYGNLRLDAPSISNNFFRSGGLPWYLPGSTTNFK